MTDHVDGAGWTGPRVTMIGSQRLGRRPQIAWGNPAVIGVFHPGAVGQGQQGGHRQHQPVSGDAGGVGTAGLVPLPAQALDGLEAQLDPEAQRVPTGSHLVRSQVGEDDPGFLLLGVPDGQQGAAAFGLGGATADPGRVGNGYDWGAGDYRVRFAPDGSDDEGEWFGLWITDQADGETTWVGSMSVNFRGD